MNFLSHKIKKIIQLTNKKLHFNNGSGLNLNVIKSKIEKMFLVSYPKKKQISSLTALKQSTIWIGWAGAGLDQVF